MLHLTLGYDLFREPLGGEAIPPSSRSMLAPAHQHQQTDVLTRWFSGVHGQCQGSLCSI